MPTIEFRVDVSGMPHSFIVMDNGGGVIQGYGFAPKEENSPYSPGQIYNNIEHEYDYTTGAIQVTNEQYNAMVDYINNSIQNPPDYNLPGSLLFPSTVQQCAQWVMDVAQHGNVSLPFTMHRGGWNPYGQAIWINLDNIAENVATLFNTATAAVRRDPLTFDLDNDGIETVGVSTTSPILFDHDADGVKTSTGWVKPDDAFLVRDVNGNGTIDNGRELFGDATLKSNSELAKDGFDALADLDSNADGKVDSADAAFASLRLWRDLNQDGISQSGELFTLSSQGIVSMNVASTDHLLTLADGNQLADLGSYTKSDGSTGSMGEVSGNMADVNLASDTFHSQFTDTIPLTTQALTLPDMHGSGQVRSLREAASLSPALATLLSDFAAADYSGQIALIDQILHAWADTSSMAATFDGAYAGHALTVTMQGITTGSDAYNALADKLTVLERFNGRTFNVVPTGTAVVTVNIWDTSQPFLLESYEALKQSVYDSLALQTRLKPLMDLIQLNIDDTGIHLDFSALATELDARIAADPVNGFGDFVDFNLASRDMLKDSGWDGVTKIVDYLNTHTITTDMAGILAGHGVKVKGFASYGSVRTGDDVMIGSNDSAVNKELAGGAGNDTLYGLSANDTLKGEDGNDQLLGSFAANDGEWMVVA